ncbi:bifunctional folylpolyglutamate synthase/dihydrofolate synthase [Chloroflexota bacterium]
MEYQEALEYILSFADYERWPGFAYAGRFDLRRMDLFLARLGNPHLGARTIHVAGSKGKGSTAAMIAAGLISAGYRTGLYTSPHLHSFRERIAVDGESIGEGEFASLASLLKPEVEKVNRKAEYGEMTTFEILTALAFLHFQKKGAAFQVLEAGLGGRLDATNIVRAEVSVITSISLDHQAVLGNTIAEIAAEKAGIIKAGGVVVSSPQTEEAAEVIGDACRQSGAELIKVGEQIGWRKISSDLRGQSLEVRGRRGDYRITIPLLGAHQIENAAAAVAALEAASIPQQAIADGLAATRWPGRLEVLKEKPYLVIDGAHNVNSAKRLVEAIREHFDFDRLLLIIGTSADKDAAGMIAELAALSELVIATRTRHPRSTDPERLADEFRRHGKSPAITAAVGEAVAEAMSAAAETDLVLATGSIFVIGEVIEYIKGLQPEPYPSYR